MTGAITYKPDPGPTASNSFNYAVSDNLGVSFNLATISITDNVTTAGNDVILDGIGPDPFVALAGSDTLIGDTGYDTLLGGDAASGLLFGDDGIDTLVGGAGADTLTGGLGNEVPAFTTIAGSGTGGRDTILDFDRIGLTGGDVIDLAAIDANANLTGNQAFTWIGAGTFTAAGQLRLLASGTDTLIQGDIDGDGAFDLAIVVVDGATALTDWIPTSFAL